MPIAVQAVRHPVCSIISCTHGSSVTEPIPTPHESKAHGEAAAADEPVRQKQRLTGITEADAARADHDADGEIKMPGLRRQRRQQQSAAHQRDPDLHHRARTVAVHHPADQRTDDAGNHEAEGKRAGGDAAFPAELADDRRKEQRERGPRIDADRHGHERHRDDGPAVEEGKPHLGPFAWSCF